MRNETNTNVNTIDTNRPTWSADTSYRVPARGPYISQTQDAPFKLYVGEEVSQAVILVRVLTAKDLQKRGTANLLMGYKAKVNTSTLPPPWRTEDNETLDSCEVRSSEAQ